MTTDDGKTPQQRLDENPELLEKVTEAMEHPERGVPRPERQRIIDESIEDNAELLEKLRESEEADKKVPGPTAYDVVPPELRPHRW